VRFEPQGVHAILRGVSKATKPDATPAADDEPEPKGPPVSPEALKAWFDLYRRIYTGTADTEAMALKSAQGMFPGKSVSRDKIRALRGERPIGRPKTAE
jgi:hypothetical protein